ncbi:cytochrome c oxidase subunit 3 [Neoroseomonas soli]|uniref:Cytochrome-c oxidase n=1 Tax=Neoroseomonas soli TaxID=1081025 RepID=A0A9X9WR87_9PROT|nr:cytochrome c oxidase subunit 3 [Neoroseomonas soli]MBR0669666.1 cytochrome-c oxidase [Neoroseomonas soli]
MSAILIYLALIGSVVAWWLSRQRLMAKPWLEVGVPVDAPGMGASGIPPARLGLWVFIAVVGALLTLFISAYLMRMHMSDDWRSLPTPPVLWFNTALLAFSSIGLHRAQMAARIGWREGIAVGLAAGGLSALAFLAGQYLAWRQVMEEGFGVATNPSSSFFYLITAVHGLHLVGGVVALGKTAYRTARGAPLAQLRLATELCATYWHFLLVAWIVLFGLLLHG